jgi:hypothetical protein
MKRGLILAALLVSVVVLLFTLVMWAASYVAVAFGTDDGKVYILWTIPTQERGIRGADELFVERLSLARTNVSINPNQVEYSQWQHAGIEFIGSPTISAFGISLLYLALIPLVLVCYFAHLLRRQRRRERLGLCLACGYDLRESRGRCPECGSEAVAQEPAAGVGP